jgi:hypothetical protein
VESPVKVCFTSRSSAGAWQIRGEQIAALRTNWKAVHAPSEQDIAQSDVVCVVKKPDARVLQAARRLRKPVVYDIVDSWAQPEDGLKYTDRLQAKSLFSAAWNAIGADGYVFPTRRMQEDLGQLVRHGVTIYHHYWPQIQRNPLRGKVEVVGYEGADYLGEWLPRIQQACDARGLRFVANPRAYTDLDIVVLARGGVHSSFLSRSYKSNVKLANAYGSGTPALVHIDEMSAHDTDAGDVLFFSDHAGSFERQLDRLVGDPVLRRAVHERFLAVAPRFHVETIVAQFESFFLWIRDNARNAHA